jgi:hypothetical protein
MTGDPRSGGAQPLRALRQFRLPDNTSQIEIDIHRKHSFV